MVALFCYYDKKKTFTMQIWYVHEKSTALKHWGFSEGASDEDIKKAHRKLIIENHPDKFGQDAAARAKAEEKTKH